MINQATNAIGATETVATAGPYTLEILRPGSPGCSEGNWRWAIRKNGKMHQRSDRALPNEDRAKADGLAMIERARSGVDAW